MEKDNLKLWSSVEKTDPKNTKNYKGKGGFNGTAICAQSQRHKATELWGPYGGSWGVREETYEIMKLSEKPEDSILVYKSTFYSPEGEFPIVSEIPMWNITKNYTSANNDIHKKVSTDALTKGLSLLGFNADIFMGKYDDNKYINDLKEKFNKKTPVSRVKLDSLLKAMDALETLSDLVKWWGEIQGVMRTLPPAQKKELENTKDILKPKLTKNDKPVDGWSFGNVDSESRISKTHKDLITKVSDFAGVSILDVLKEIEVDDLANIKNRHLDKIKNYLANIK